MRTDVGALEIDSKIWADHFGHWKGIRGSTRHDLLKSIAVHYGPEERDSGSVI